MRREPKSSGFQIFCGDRHRHGAFSNRHRGFSLEMTSDGYTSIRNEAMSDHTLGSELATAQSSARRVGKRTRANNRGELAASLPRRVAVQSLFSCVHNCLVRTLGCRLHTGRSLSLRAWSRRASRSSF